MKRLIIAAAALLAGFGCTYAQNCDMDLFKEPVHKVDSMFRAHKGCWARLSVSKIVCTKGKGLNIHFGESISDFPLRVSDKKWLREAFNANLPSKYEGYSVNGLFCGGKPLDALIVSEYGNNGSPSPTRLHSVSKRSNGIVDRGIKAPLGLSGRHIALWQSHGRYYNISRDEWMWQRACIFQIVEDLSTQSYVVPFLAPMLENAGANVFLPRERDCSREEVIIDNDSFEISSSRIHGYMELVGKWEKAGTGFADTKPSYTALDNPFTMGSCLGCKCSSKEESLASWRASVPKRGEYAVYVSYASFPNSCKRAKYTVHALGGDREVYVDQSIGAGEWLYIGSYEFDPLSTKLVSLSNRSSQKNSVVVADAVKIGGGMGNIARSRAALKDATHEDSLHLSTSGMPRFAEGARYFLQWSGVPSEVWNLNEQKDDYRDDFMCRGKWVQHLAGGSRAIPKEKGLGIPIDLSMAFHTDAGTRKDDKIVGTLAIYTLNCDGSSKFANGESRSQCRELTDMLQSQVVDDVRELCDSSWLRRMLWNRSYSESRTTGVPGVLLELLSHQNFEDMKYGLDPQFRFIVSRACYKAMLKYLSSRYNCPYAVQPLPVKSFSAGLSGKTVSLRWKQREDPLEPTAKAESYIVYRRIDDGGWDKGRKVSTEKWTDEIEPGHIHSYKVVAVNKGGLSFPSEILSAGIPSVTKGKALVVNNFHRVSGPTWFDTPSYAGFDGRSDGGVPYIKDWSYIGDMFEYRRDVDYVSDDNCGFGASYSDYADKVVAGNTFDYPYVHGVSLMHAGWSFSSCSSDALPGADVPDCDVVDIICGKECRVKTASRAPVRGGIFSENLLEALKGFAAKGCDVIISGSYIGTDSFSSVYPINYTARDTDALLSREGELENSHRNSAGDIVLIDRSAERAFIKDSLGFCMLRAHGTKTGVVTGLGIEASFPVVPCVESYCAENCDALSPVGGNATKIMRYADTSLGAAVLKRFPGRSVAAFAFPLEIVRGQKERDRIFENTLSLMREKRL